MARPRIKIDQASFEKLCSLQCTLAEIAVFFGCSEDTIERWCKRIYHSGFAEVFAQKRNLGKIALRRSQFRLAEKNATMAIFLGKQYLGQREEVTSDDIRDDGFLDALQEKASDLWAEGVDDYDFVMPEAEENESGL
ncbi:MAG: helix-turn-helix domain-containing protein [Oscillospiraceae bacterium]|jgi:hypothetical protein|nr:helix-turn-helix domain-containing protein [Oscillospiraceae bacterium]DAK03305.1 MAG TPA: putative terminase small subunit [Caudoviricetes sp.]